MPALTPWQRAAALAAEGLYLPLALAAHLAALALPERFDAVRPAVAPVLLLLLGAPAVVGRQGFYIALCRDGDGRYSLRPLGAGFLRYGSAVSWYRQVWTRRLVLLALSALPAVVLWRLGEREGALSPLWLAAGALSFLLVFVPGRLWLCRYAAAPLLLLEGYPAAAAMQLSARVMRGHLLEYLTFWLSRLGRAAACLLILPLPWLLPALRRERTALLLSFRTGSGVPPGHDAHK